MARVFVSFASADLTAARFLHDRLRVDGHEVFLDRDVLAGIRVGEDWRERLHSELRGVDAVVSLVSQDALASPWCNAELAVADTLGCRLLPVRLEPDLVHPLLGHLHHADYAADPEQALALLRQSLSALLPAGHAASDGNPFPGLDRFTVDQAAIFHGRAADIREVANRLRRARTSGGILAIVGPSGCGKSSLLNAGVLHAFTRDDGWLCLPPFEPGSDPLTSLARSIFAAAKARRCDWTVPEVRARLWAPTGLAQVLVDLLDADLRVGCDRVLLPIDQAEELFTRSSAESREQLCARLGAALGVPVHVLVTLRSEYLDDLTTLATAAEAALGAYVLAPLSTEMLRVVIEEPARLAGLRLAPELASRLVADTASGEALPLLAFTLRELADGLGRGGTMTAARYEALGGVGGALARHADVTLEIAVAQSGLTAQQVLVGLVRMVTVDDAGRRARRRVRFDGLPEPLRRAIGVFVDSRLLVSDGHEITVAHEKMLTAWPPLDGTIKELTAALGAAHSVEQAAEEWRRAGQARPYLWIGERLIATRALVGAGGGAALEISDDACAFLAASEQQTAASSRRARRLRRVTMAGLSLLVVLALGVAGLFYAALQTAQANTRNTAARQLLGAATSLAGTDPWTALRLAVASNRLAPSREAQDVLLGSLGFSTFTAIIGPLGSPVAAVAFARDGKTIALGEVSGKIDLWDVTDRERPRRVAAPVGHTAAVTGLAFSPAGSLMASVGSDGGLLLWSVVEPDKPIRSVVLPPGPPLWSVTFSPDGRMLATTADDGTVQLWKVGPASTTSRAGPPIRPGTGRTWAAAFVGDGGVLATAGSDSMVRLWQVADPQQPVPVGPPLAGHTAAVWSVATDPQRPTLLASGGSDGRTFLWDLSDPRNPRRQGDALVGQGAITRVAFETPQKGRYSLVTASSDRSIALWNVTDPQHAVRYTDAFLGHTSSVTSVAVSPDGQTLVSGGYDANAVLWNLNGPRTAQLATLRARQPVAAGALSWVAASADGRLIATADARADLRLTTVPGAGPPHTGSPQPSGQEKISAGAFVPGRPLLATGGQDGTVRLWNVAEGQAPHAVGPGLLGHSGPVRSLAVSPDGRLLAAGSIDRTVIFWDISDPERPQRIGLPLEAAVSPLGVTALAILPDGHTVVAAVDSGVLIAWNIADPTHPAVLSQVIDVHRDVVTAIAVTRDGKSMATSSADYRTALWDVSEPAQMRSVSGPVAGHVSGVTAAAFTPDGETLFTSGFDGRVIAWDATDRSRPQALGILYGLAPVQPTGLTVTSGRVLGVAMSDGSLALADLADLQRLRAGAIAVACARAGGPLDPQQWSVFVPGLDYEDTCA